MQLDVNGKNYSVASSAVGNTALGFGIAGTALGLMNNGGCGNNGGLLGGLFGGNRCNDCYVTEREQNLAIALSQAQSKEQALQLAREEDAKIADVLKQTNSGLIEVANGVSRNDVRLACLEKDVAFLQRESERNLAEAKSYTDMKVEHEAQLRKAGDDAIAAWADKELQKKIDGVLNINSSSINYQGCRPVLQQCGSGSSQNPYFVSSTPADVTAITNAVLAAVKAAQPTA